MDKEYLTPQGYNKLLKALDFLIKEKRQECIADIANSQTSGDIAENTEYLNALEERDKVEYKIKELTSVIDNCKIIDILQFADDNIVHFGSTVTVFDTNLEKEFTYRIVGALEASIKEGTISYKSPIAKELIGKKVGSYVDLVTPSGIRELHIVSTGNIAS